jgi:hypothetical protein
MKQITVIENQTVFDIAIQEFGNVEAVFLVLEDNPDIKNEETVTLYDGIDFDIAHYIKAGSVLNISENTTYNMDVITKQFEQKIIS